VSDLTVRYQSVTAVSDLKLDLHAGEIVALMGRNGAGKSSLLAALTGLVRPAAGLPAGSAGRVFGPGFGFVLGNVAMFASAVLTGGGGPWLPFQMLAAGWIGLGAGLLPRFQGRGELAMLAGYGFFAGVGYGFVMNLWFWPFATSQTGAAAAVAFVPGDPWRRICIAGSNSRSRPG
jgi:energy-coupling factor transport system substrate-specific component